MDPVAIEFPATNNPYDIRIGMVFESDATARAFVNAHAINNNFAVKNGVVKNKDDYCLYASATESLSTLVSSHWKSGLKETMGSPVRKLLEACSVTAHGEFVSKDNSTIHGSLQSSPSNMTDIRLTVSIHALILRPVTVALATMFDLVQHSSASFSTIAPVLNSNYGLSLLGRDVYNRTYDNFREYKSPSARFIETLRDEGYIYSVKLCTDSTLEALSFCNPDDVQRARLYGQTVIIDATYKTNKFRLPLVNFVAVDNNLRTVRVALCFVTCEHTSAYIWALEQLKDIVFPDEAPRVIITDADRALMNALSVARPNYFLVYSP